MPATLPMTKYESLGAASMDTDAFKLRMMLNTTLSTNPFGLCTAEDMDTSSKFVVRKRILDLLCQFSQGNGMHVRVSQMGSDHYHIYLNYCRVLDNFRINLLNYKSLCCNGPDEFYELNASYGAPKQTVDDTCASQPPVCDEDTEDMKEDMDLVKDSIEAINKILFYASNITA